MYAEAYRNNDATQGKAAADAMTLRFIALGDTAPSFRLGPRGLQALFNGQSETAYLGAMASKLGLQSVLSLRA